MAGSGNKLCFSFQLWDVILYLQPAEDRKGVTNMSKRLKIVVACGSGVATSTLASKVVEEVCKENGIEASIETCGMSSVAGTAEHADVVLTTSRYEKELRCPVMSVTSFITGIRAEKTKKDLGELLRQIAEV